MTITTDADIARIKFDNLEHFPEHRIAPGPGAELGPDGTPRVYNCERCDLRFTCPFSMDPYNTGSDCLADK